MTEDYSKTTRGICVSVRASYLADQSKPDESQFVWAYRFTIANQGQETVQLLRRTWHITDANGRVQRVHGPGVVGQQPVIEPGESFEYTSGTPLETPSGFMTGAYHMQLTGSREKFDVEIPLFSLDRPDAGRRVH